ncbi:I78 family peptidase inhibitor [Xylophilus ampelinus]|uniref:Peptidase inhibitor I78 family protein n=1 Tax=Xylophilus ampelinus TaxID=54067 RepID=A0A318SID9_9BURK|nr:I78 family peptidase inhibitor [Xylophilus ampelinus]MCS4511511.1 I78 family peptidase inhibitor [Xylophilus ampelinus]PYE74367.1 peptidase inhibitor I78 family protein [Xylophilus ampelinus]
MKRSLLALCALAGVSLQACALLPSRAPAPSMDAVPASGAICDATNAQFAVGKTVDQRLGEEARGRAGASVVRVLRPGQVVTMEFSASRLTLDADAQGVVTRARCG